MWFCESKEGKNILVGLFDSFSKSVADRVFYFVFEVICSGHKKLILNKKKHRKMLD